MRILMVILLFSSSAQVLSCACCGVDNTWLQKLVSYPNYPTQILPELNLINGEFDDGQKFEYSARVSNISLSDNVYQFKLNKGYVTFAFDSDVQFDSTDISFITQPKSQLIDEATIYHELILTGKLQASKLMIEESKMTDLAIDQPAKLILKGVGNSCLDAAMFKVWTLIIDNQEIELYAHGSVVDRSANKIKPLE